jgi:hypothetical protein
MPTHSHGLPCPQPPPTLPPNQIVPEDMRSLVYAFDRSLESSLAACAAPAVGLLAERAFGFTGAVSRDSLADVVVRSRNAGALGSSLLVCMAVPWTACLLFYTVLHWTYVREGGREGFGWWGRAGLAHCLPQNHVLAPHSPPHPSAAARLPTSSATTGARRSRRPGRASEAPARIPLRSAALKARSNPHSSPPGAAAARHEQQYRVGQARSPA